VRGGGNIGLTRRREPTTGMDEKVLAVNAKDAHFEEIKSMRDLHEHPLREIAEFFSTYKSLEKNKWAKVGGWRGTEDTYSLVKLTHETWKKKFEAAVNDAT
jgi:inorganic pyrophosphatase